MTTLQLMSSSDVVEEWRKQDPYLLDAEGMTEFIDRRLQAQELLRLIRLCHPTEHGEAITRGEVIHRIYHYGLKILEDLGWTTDMNSVYKNLHTGELETLRDCLWWLHDDLDPYRSKMHQLEEDLNDLTNGDWSCLYFGEEEKCSLKIDRDCESCKSKLSRGLETFPVNTIRKLLKKHPTSNKFSKRQ